MKITNLLLTLLLLSCCQISIAQPPPGGYSIRGIIADSASHRAMSFITVHLLQGSNTALNVDYSKADGSFSLVGLQAGRYWVVMVG